MSEKSTAIDLTNFFDRVVVINLARRVDRMEQFWSLITDWPFKKPQRFEAADGAAVGVPDDWKKGPGAWGCMLSHRAVIESAIADRAASILVLEDDAHPAKNFSALATDFLTRVPEDWDCLMFGGEHLRPTIPVTPGVVKCVGTNRTHAYAIRGKMMPILLQFWLHFKTDHCDIVLASLMRHFKTYAPDPFLIGQAAGYSDITSQAEPLRFYSSLDIETATRLAKAA